MDNILSKRKKPDAEALSDKLDSSISADSPMLEQLQLMERQLDARIMRRMLAIQESIKAPNRVTRTLRLHVSNSYAHQEHQEADPEVVEPPCWTLKVSGYMLDDAGARMASTPATRFTQYLSKVAITLDEKLYPGSQALIEWIKNPSEPPTDSFEIKRQGNIDSVCRLSFFMDYAPEKFALPAILATALNLKVDTKAKILNAMFAYIKNRNLLDALNPTTLKCDDVLREVFQVTEFPIYELSNRLTARLSRPDPLSVSYRIRVSGDPTTLEDVYEIPIEVPAEPDFDLRKLVTLHDELLKKIEKTNEDMAEMSTRLFASKRRREFLLGFSEAPEEAIAALLAAQTRETQFTNAATRAIEERKHAAFYTDEWIADAVDRYVQRLPAAM